MNLPTLKELPLDQIINFSTPEIVGYFDPVRFMALMEEAKSLVTPGYYFGDNLFAGA